jgi:hypothetical protein
MNDIIEAITLIANLKSVKNHVEPNLMWHQNITRNQVERVLYSYFLLLDEHERMRKDETNPS